VSRAGVGTGPGTAYGVWPGGHIKAYMLPLVLPYGICTGYHFLSYPLSWRVS